MKMNRPWQFTLGLSLMACAYAPLLYGAFHGLPTSVNRVAWFATCAIAFPWGVYLPRFENKNMGPDEVVFMAVIVVPACFLGWAIGGAAMQGLWVWGAWLTTMVPVTLGTKILKSWAKDNRGWLESQPKAPAIKANEGQ